MFDPETEKYGAKRRSLLSYRKRRTGGTDALDVSGRPMPDMTRKFEAALAGDNQFEQLPGTEDDASTATDHLGGAGAGYATVDARPANGEKPLIDPHILVATAWRFRSFVAFTTVLGAAVGVMVALSTPHLYEAESQFVLDPRELRLTDTDFLPQSYSSDSTLALVDSQVAIVDSSPVLQAVVNDLNLADDPEFNGNATGGFGSAIAILRDLLTGSSDGASDRNYLAVQALSRAVSASRGERTFIVYVSAETEDPVKSAQIANTVVDEYIKKQQESQSALFERTAASLNTQLDELRRDVETAERRVEQYRAENDLVNAGGNLISDTQLLELNQQLAQVRAQKVEIQVRAETARQLNVDALLSGTAPEILQSSTIGELRAEYAGAKRSFDALATSLGPRHPSRIAAEQALATARSEISNELRRIVEATQTELKRIIQSEQQLSSDLAVLKSRQATTSTDLVRLRELEREAAATSQIYQSFLRRARETSEQQNLNTSNIRVISEATPPINPSGPSRKVIATVGTLIGFLVGLGIAMLIGAYRSVRQNTGDLFREETVSLPEQNEPVEPETYETDEPLPAQTMAAVSGDWDQPDNDGWYDEDDDWPDDNEGWADDPDREADDIRAQISEMRDMVERLRDARRSARETARRA
ncbi:MAG: GumC family protein [Alphaproteobacteria bacterium]|nr:GumC family protein [Alphaproteobacteria bacterium]